MYSKSRRKRLGFRVHDVAPVEVAAAEAEDEHFRRRHIAGKGDVILVAQAGNIAHALAGLFIARIVEEEHHVDLVVGDACADLLRAAVYAREEEVDGQTRRLGDHLAGNVGRADGVLGEDACIGCAELHHQVFFVVVCHESDIHITAPLSIVNL